MNALTKMRKDMKHVLQIALLASLVGTTAHSNCINGMTLHICEGEQYGKNSFNNSAQYLENGEGYADVGRKILKGPELYENIWAEHEFTQRKPSSGSDFYSRSRSRY